ncbi:SpoIID/LytB domain-containing protein [Alkaliflexus imshenetskii]|uniref:SpoIID/LytB domain-containing protein n=1 Tax=Alkaliflexus imshenetskii TaxID=286730 RepID=UPI0004AFCF67|nr:SpoIID/LytB domain-containing protein [Alkaliflexus imshenetskii]
MTIQPEIQVGILSATTIRFRLNGPFYLKNHEMALEGEGVAILKGEEVMLHVGDTIVTAKQPVDLVPKEYNSADFDLMGVLIGINFHWERKEDQKFRGTLRFIAENDRVRAINILPLEDYLLSVISSEMSATSSMELLKAHAVISRSWLLAQIEKGEEVKKTGHYTTTIEKPGERIRWYDREDHAHFDVCADDHCQRYQGITKASTKAVKQAIEATFGEVLLFNNKICDARFSKCCGGISELFENTWEPINHPYLAMVVDSENIPEGYNMDMTQEINAKEWIRTAPDCFCNTSDKQILSQILNDYDQETPDFFRWTRELSQLEIKNLLKTKTDIDVGDVLNLEPLERGVSGRITKLKITGSQSSFVIGKELEIRKALSPSHLYSSDFVVDKQDEQNGIPDKFILTGAGWGHGVGLCQIGAAVMSAKGYDYRKILSHYFKEAITKRVYG